MIGIDDIRNAIDIFSLVTNLGKQETASIKSELNTLIALTKTSLESMLEVVESIDKFKFDPENFDESSFDELYRKCRRYYLIPEEKEKLQKQCKAVFSQAETIQSKLQQILQVENINIQELNGLLLGMKVGKVRYVDFIDENIRNLKTFLELTRNHLDKGDFPAASLCFNQLKSKMSKDLEVLNDVRKAMDDANNHIVTILH